MFYKQLQGTLMALWESWVIKWNFTPPLRRLGCSFNIEMQLSRELFMWINHILWTQPSSLNSSSSSQFGFCLVIVLKENRRCRDEILRYSTVSPSKYVFGCVVCCFLDVGRGCEPNCVFSHWKTITEIWTTVMREETKEDVLCDNDTLALLHEWLLWSFFTEVTSISAFASCATLTRPASDLLNRWQRTEMQLWITVYLCFVSLSTVNAVTFKVFSVLFKFLPKTFPECVDAFGVGNG